MAYYIGLDLGGTAIKGGILDDDKNIVASGSIDTQAKGGSEHVISRLAELADRLLQEAGIDKADVRGLGVGTPGPIDPKTQVVLHAPNLGWHNVALGAELQAKVGVPVQVLNDANAACFGEFVAGAAKAEHITDIVLLTLGTGIGGGIVIGGKLFIGVSGNGAELGHHIVMPHGRPCGCKQQGCIEQYASATAIAREAKQRIADGAKSSMPADPSTKDVWDAVEKGDAVASEVVDEACELLGIAIVSYLHALDSQMVILGGGVAAAGEKLRSRVEDAVRKHYWKAASLHSQIQLATLGNDAGFIGAAGLARAQFG